MAERERAGMKRIIFLALSLPLWVAAQPAPQDGARLKPFVPAGFEVVSALHVPLQSKDDLVAMLQKDQVSRVFVLPKGAGKPLWLTLKDKKQDLPAPVQGGSGEKLSDLVFSCDLDRNGKPYLFVTCYLADAYCLLVFKPSAGGYSEIFRDSTNGKFTIDHKSGRIQRPGSEADPARTFRWSKGHYQ